MNKFSFALFFLALFAGNKVFAQDSPDFEKPKQETKSIVYTFSDKDLNENMSSHFMIGAEYFYLSTNGKTKKVPLNVEINEDYFKSLASNKKLKLTAAEYLFIKVAAKNWSENKTMVLQDKDNADLRYMSDDYKGYSAEFYYDENYCKLVNGKTHRTFKLTEDFTSKYFFTLAENKELNITPAEMQFVMNACKVWETKIPYLGYKYEASGLGIKVIKEGNGAYPQNGKKVVVHYRGQLMDGTVFDSSIERGQPFSFTLGKGRVIKGWDEGIAKLKIGSKAYLLIPPSLGYGSRGGGPIPPNSTLIFYVEIVGAN